MHTVELKGEIRDSSKDVTIQEITPSSVQIKFDSLQTKTLDIKAKLSGYSAPDDYLIRDVSVSPKHCTDYRTGRGYFQNQPVCCGKGYR